MVLYVLQLGHHQLHPSLQALVVRVIQFIGTLHVVQFMLLASSPLLFRKLMAAIVLLAKIIGVDIAMTPRRPQKGTSKPRVGYPPIQFYHKSTSRSRIVMIMQ